MLFKLAHLSVLYPTWCESKWLCK